MKPVTDGERLFLLLRDELLDASGHGHVKWSNLSILFTQIGGRPEFGSYLRGAAAIHLTRRLLRFWEVERVTIAQESQYVRKVASYIRDEVLPSLGKEQQNRLARAVVAAEKSCHQTISQSVRTRVIDGRHQIPCYLCQEILNPRAKQNEPSFLTLEHLWPQSVGGDSVEENLLPACARCQNITKDTMSWEWFNVYNVVLPSDPSDRAIASVSRKGHFARHFFEAMRVANEGGLSLKESFSAIGPISQPVRSVSTGGPTTFFDLDTKEEERHRWQPPGRNR